MDLEPDFERIRARHGTAPRSHSQRYPKERNCASGCHNSRAGFPVVHTVAELPRRASKSRQPTTHGVTRVAGCLAASCREKWL